MPNSDAGQNEANSIAGPYGDFRRPTRRTTDRPLRDRRIPPWAAQFGVPPGPPQTDHRAGFYQPQIAPGVAGPAPGAGLVIKPWHLLWMAAAVFLLLALFVSSGLNWVLLAVACGLSGGTCVSDTRPRRLQPGRQTAPTPLIPLRAMAIPEIFSGTAKIMVRYWPALLGIPVAILAGFVLFVYASGATISTIVVKATMSVGAGGLANLDR